MVDGVLHRLPGRHASDEQGLAQRLDGLDLADHAFGRGTDPAEDAAGSCQFPIHASAGSRNHLALGQWKAVDVGPDLSVEYARQSLPLGENTMNVAILANGAQYVLTLKQLVKILGYGTPENNQVVTKIFDEKGSKESNFSSEVIKFIKDSKAKVVIMEMNLGNGSGPPSFDKDFFQQFATSGVHFVTFSSANPGDKLKEIEQATNFLAWLSKDSNLPNTLSKDTLKQQLDKVSGLEKVNSSK